VLAHSHKIQISSRLLTPKRKNVKHIVILSHPLASEIETTDIENMNSIFRERIGRLVRKTKCHSKKKSRLLNATEFFQFYWNFMDTLHDNKTLGLIESLSDYVWNWEKYFRFNYVV